MQNKVKPYKNCQEGGGLIPPAPHTFFYFYSFWTKCISPAGRAQDYLSMRKKNLYFWKSLWSSYPKNQFLMSKGRPMVAISCQKVGRWSQVYNKSCWKYNWSHCTNFSSQKVWKMNSWRTIYSPFPHEPHTQIPNYILHVLSSFILKFEFPRNFPELPNYPPILRKEVTIITHPYCFVRWSTHDALTVKLHAWNSCVWAYFKVKSLIYLSPMSPFGLNLIKHEFSHEFSSKHFRPMFQLWINQAIGFY